MPTRREIFARAGRLTDEQLKAERTLVRQGLARAIEQYEELQVELEILETLIAEREDAAKKRG